MITPQLLRRIHGVLTIVWLILIVPSLVLWSKSVPWLVLMSAYAIVVSHWSAWQSSRSEVYMDESDKV